MWVLSHVCGCLQDLQTDGCPHVHCVAVSDAALLNIKRSEHHGPFETRENLYKSCLALRG